MVGGVWDELFSKLTKSRHAEWNVAHNCIVLEQSREKKVANDVEFFTSFEVLIRFPVGDCLS